MSMFGCEYRTDRYSADTSQPTCENWRSRNSPCVPTRTFSLLGISDGNKAVAGRHSSPVLHYCRLDKALSFWSTGHNIDAPAEISSRSQKSWDYPMVQLVHTRLVESLPNATDRARLLAVSAKRSSDWLHALPISSCGLFLEDEAVRISVGLRLGAKLCEPHACPCGAQVDARGLHSLSCRRSAGRLSRHHNINDIIWRALTKAGVPSTKEPYGLSRTDGKRPDGLTLIPWSSGNVPFGMSQ